MSTASTMQSIQTTSMTQSSSSTSENSGSLTNNSINTGFPGMSNNLDALYVGDLQWVCLICHSFVVYILKFSLCFYRSGLRMKIFVKLLIILGSTLNSKTLPSQNIKSTGRVKGIYLLAPIAYRLLKQPSQGGLHRVPQCRKCNDVEELVWQQVRCILTFPLDMVIFIANNLTVISKTVEQVRHTLALLTETRSARCRKVRLKLKIMIIVLTRLQCRTSSAWSAYEQPTKEWEPE